MKIQGLIRVFNRVRAKLQTGLAPDEIGPFQEHVKAIVREVEEICRKNGVVPEHLPAPTLRTYRFLKDLDLENLPVRSGGAETVTPPVIRLKNVVKIGEQLSARLWQQLDALIASDEARRDLRREMERHASDIERLCANQRATPSVLELPSRQVYCWLKFLLSEANLTIHLEALRCAQEALDALQPQPVKPVQVYLLGMSALAKKKIFSDAILFKVNEGFLYADRRVWDAAVGMIASNLDQTANLLMQEYAGTEDFNEVLFEMESFAAPAALPAQGCVHNLELSFDRVNTAYFGGQMPKPNLIWNRTLTARKFGHYQRSRDTLMVSVSLDDPQVPEYLIDFVIYHELLHKKLGRTVINGRQLAHSPSFRAEERRFTEYQQAMRCLGDVVLKQRGLTQLSAVSTSDVYCANSG